MRKAHDSLWWILAALLPLILCTSKLQLDLWSDEAFTLIFFVSQPVRTIVTDFSVPNNHIFYSLCLRPFYLVSGSNLILRLPSLLMTAGTLGMLFRVVRRHDDRLAAVLAVAWLGLTEMFLIYTMQVRGYGLSMLLSISLANLALARELGWPGQATIAVLGALFLYTLPTNLLFLIPLAIAAIMVNTCRERTWRHAAAVAWPWAAACALAALFYLPVAAQLIAASGTRVASPLVAGLVMAGRLLGVAFHDWLLLIPLLGFGAARRFHQLRQNATTEQLALPIVVASVLFGSILLVALFGRKPFLRNLCPTLPFLAAGVGWLLAESLRGVRGFVCGRFGHGKVIHDTAGIAALGYVALVAITLPAVLTYAARLSEYRQTRFVQDGYFNYYAANFHPAAVVTHLKTMLPKGQSYEIVFPDADHFCLAYYFAEAGVPLQRTVAGSTPIFYMITPALVDYDALGTRYEIPPDALRNASLLRDFGYYRLHCLNGS